MTVALAIVLATVAVLCTLQYGQVLSQLVRQRLGVTVEAAAAPFQSVVEMGLPASMVRNGRELLLRAQDTDAAISEVRLFNPTGIIVASTKDGQADPMPKEAVRVQTESKADHWSLEMGDVLVSGVSIRNEAGVDVAGIAASYPISELSGPVDKVASEVTWAALAIFVGFGALAIAVLRLRLRAVSAALVQLGAAAGRLRAGERLGETVDTRKLGLLNDDLTQLTAGLNEATGHHQAGLSLLPETSDEGAPTKAGRRELLAIPETRLARRLARTTTPIVAALLVGATLLLGAFAYQRVEQSLTPEFDRRVALIGTVAREAISRTVEAGVPIDALVGAGEYFEGLLAGFPEISYFAITTDAPLLEVGTHEGGRVAALPIDATGAQPGTILVESNPQYLAEQFRNVVLDLAVIVTVVVLLSLELVVLVMGGSITGPFDRVLFLVNLQAAGDFTRRLSRRGRGVIDQIGETLSKRAEQLNARYSARLASGHAEPDLPRLHLTGQPPAVIRLCNVGDVRLALFLFAAADQLPLSFYSLFARAVENPFPWIDEGLAISLPLAAYLVAALFGAGAARPLADRFGHRGQFLAAAAVTILANAGLFASGNLLEVIGYSVLNGLGFALASLACQDYVIDRLPKEQRARSISVVSGALFAGVFAGTALGGVMADRLGQRPVFLVAALMVLISGALILWLMPAGDRLSRDDTVKPRESFSLNLLTPMRSFGFAALALGVVVPQVIADQVFVSYLVALALDGLGASIADIARVMMAYFLVLIGAGYVAIRLPPWMAAPASLAIAAALISGASLLAPLFWPGIGGYLVAAIGSGFGHGLSRGPAADLVVRFAEGPLAHLGTGAVLGASRVLERAGSVVGLLAVGALTGVLGYAGATAAIAALLLIGAALFAVSLLPPLGRSALNQGDNA